LKNLYNSPLKFWFMWQNKEKLFLNTKMYVFKMSFLGNKWNLYEQKNWCWNVSIWSRSCSRSKGKIPPAHRPCIVSRTRSTFSWQEHWIVLGDKSTRKNSCDSFPEQNIKYGQIQSPGTSLHTCHADIINLFITPFAFTAITTLLSDVLQYDMLFCKVPTRLTTYDAKKCNGIQALMSQYTVLYLTTGNLAFPKRKTCVHYQINNVCIPLATSASEWTQWWNYSLCYQ